MRVRVYEMVSGLIVALLASIVTGCASTEGPQNLEPSILVKEATDITRFEATVKAVIECRGSGKLSYIRFMYREGDDGEFIASNDISPVGDEVSMRLTGLRAGTTYTYYAVGGTATAVIESDRLTFTTEPNQLPKVTGVYPLSTGPTGIIVRFEITDDGGEPLEQAGCEILNRATGEKSRIYVPSELLAVGSHRLTISPLQARNEYVITSFASTRMGETLGEILDYTTNDAIVLEEQGVLSRVLDCAVTSLESVTISGPMNGDDFHYLRRLLGAPVSLGEASVASDLVGVDLTDVRITEGGNTYDGSRFCVADVVSTGLFADCTSLQQLLMPSSALTIEKDALRNCKALRVISIPANVSAVLPSAGCVALERIDVSEANENYSSHEGVLFDKGCTEILWFPENRTGTFTLPSTITSIARNAFQGTRITALVIPESVKTIERGAFAGAVLEEIVLPDGITNVSEGMFQDCLSLKEVYLGKGVNFIGNYVFDGCPLEHLYVSATDPPYVSANAFVNRTYNILKTCTLHVPSVSKSRYRNHDKWGKFEIIKQND